MNFKIRKTQEKEPAAYKTLYIKQSLLEKVDEIAKQNNTSWNNVVISMIESCLEEDGR